MTEQYLYAAPPIWNKGWGVKTLFTFDPDYWKLGIHRPKMKNKWLETDFPDRVKWLNGSGRAMEDYFKFRGWRSITRTVGYDWVQLNHYAVKSIDSYAIRKLRGNVNLKKDKYNSDYWALQDRNEVRDDTMLRYSARRNEIMAHLLADPVLGALHTRAIEMAEARLAELRGTEAYRDLVTELAQASTVPLDQIVAKPPQPRDREKIAAKMGEVEKFRTAKAREERKAESRTASAAAMILQQKAAVSDQFAGEWVANSGVLLPLDPGLFTLNALELVGKGKLDRALARRIPQVIPRGDRVLELGTSIGFLGARMAISRPDLALTLQEADACLRAATMTIHARNGIVLPEAALVAEPVAEAAELSALLNNHRPDSLLVAHSCLTAAQLADGIEHFRPRRIFLYGEFLKHLQDDIEDLDRRLADLTYQLSYGSEPTLLRGYALASVDP